MADKVYEFWYNDCIEESAAACMSLHRTRKGAEMAMEFHKEKERKRWKKFYPTIKKQKERPFGMHEAWGIEEREVFE